MATPQAAKNRFWSYLGGALVALGLAVLVVSLATLGLQIQGLMERSGMQSLGFLPALGVAFLHTAQALAFGQSGVFFVVTRLLVLFSALAAVVVGFALRRARPDRDARETA